MEAAKKVLRTPDATVEQSQWNFYAFLREKTLNVTRNAYRYCTCYRLLGRAAYLPDVQFYDVNTTPSNPFAHGGLMQSFHFRRG